jgi:hypothetical protein
MTDMDTNRVTTDIVLKLFDTIRDSNLNLKTSVEKQTDAIVHFTSLLREGVKPEDIKKLVEKQTDAIIHLTSLIKEGVKPEEIKKIVEAHDSSTVSTLTKVDTCTETIQDKSNVILDILSVLNKRVMTMITIVCIAFSLMTVSYFVVSNSMDKMVYQKITKAIETQIPKTFSDKNANDIFREIESIRKEIKKFHNEDTN